MTLNPCTVKTRQRWQMTYLFILLKLQEAVVSKQMPSSWNKTRLPLFWDVTDVNILLCGTHSNVLNAWINFRTALQILKMAWLFSGSLDHLQSHLPGFYVPTSPSTFALPFEFPPGAPASSPTPKTCMRDETKLLTAACIGLSVSALWWTDDWHE